MNRTSIIVIGAGMVGTSTAIHLVQRGHDVVLVDRKSAGSETSFGNAGIIQSEALRPTPFPREIDKFIKFASKQSAAVNYHVSVLPSLAKTLFHYWRASEVERHLKTAVAYGALVSRSADEHASLIKKANAGDLVQRDGYKVVFRHLASMQGVLDRAEQLKEEYGIRFAALDPGELAAAEPALTRQLAGAIHWLDPWSVSNPGKLVELFSVHFLELGGRLEQATVTRIDRVGAGWEVKTTSGSLNAMHVVVAAGPWSSSVVKPLGYKFPFFVKRGYHMHYSCPRPPKTPIFDLDGGFVMSPMLRGLRITTGVEFAEHEAPPSPVQVQKASKLARELLEIGEELDPAPWLGARPCVADMLPIMGPAPRHPNLWFNFGHAHQGFTMGPVCGRLLAELIDQDKPLVDPLPYSPSRFEGAHYD